MAQNKLTAKELDKLADIISGDSGGWQAAHAFRQLPDGRVQILTNPRGRVPTKINIVKRNPNISGGETAWAQNATLSQLRDMLDNFEYNAKHEAWHYTKEHKAQQAKYKAIVKKEIARRERNLRK